MAAINAHISQLELLFLRCLLECKVFLSPHAAILLLSYRLKKKTTTNLLTYLGSGFGIVSTTWLSGYMISSNNGLGAECPSQDELIDQGKV